LLVPKEHLAEDAFALGDGVEGGDGHRGQGREGAVLQVRDDEQSGDGGGQTKREKTRKDTSEALVSLVGDT
jgi:hypothetical protein